MNYGRTITRRTTIHAVKITVSATLIEFGWVADEASWQEALSSAGAGCDRPLELSTTQQSRR
jgi:hypothetical protein